MITIAEKRAVKEFIASMENDVLFLEFILEQTLEKRDKQIRDEDPVKYDNFTFRIDASESFIAEINKQIKKLKNIWEIG